MPSTSLALARALSSPCPRPCPCLALALARAPGSAARARTVKRMTSFSVGAILGVALGFLFGIGCAAAVLYTIFLAGYRRAVQDALHGGTAARYREHMRKLQTKSEAGR